MYIKIKGYRINLNEVAGYHVAAKYLLFNLHGSEDVGAFISIKFNSEEEAKKMSNKVDSITKCINLD